MKAVNRSALVVRPREPYLKWAAAVFDEDLEAHQDSADHVSVYLVPADPEEVAETAPLEEIYERVFDLELAGWCTDDARWPSPRTLELFLEWFDVVGESLVVDLGQGKLRSEVL